MGPIFAHILLLSTVIFVPESEMDIVSQRAKLRFHARPVL